MELIYILCGIAGLCLYTFIVRMLSFEDGYLSALEDRVKAAEESLDNEIEYYINLKNNNND